MKSWDEMTEDEQDDYFRAIVRQREQRDKLDRANFLFWAVPCGFLAGLLICLSVAAFGQ